MCISAAAAAAVIYFMYTSPFSQRHKKKEIKKKKQKTKNENTDRAENLTTAHNKISLNFFNKHCYELNIDLSCKLLFFLS